MLLFVEGGKLENPEKNPWSKARTKTKLNPHMAPAGIETRPHWWEGSALTTVPFLLPKICQSVDLWLNISQYVI